VLHIKNESKTKTIIYYILVQVYSYNARFMTTTKQHFMAIHHIQKTAE